MTAENQTDGGRLVFLTGGTGFIGKRLARLLADRGDKLRFLLTADSLQRNRAEISRLGGEWVVGCITDVDALKQGLEGAQLAYHIAGKFDLGVVDREELEKINIQGTRAFLQAIAAAGTPRAIVTSSTSVLAPARNGEGDEHTPVWDKLPTVYQQTKAEAHRLAQAAQERGAPLIIVCPSYVYGPDNTGPGGRYMADLLAGRVPGLISDSGWFSYVHVDDVADGMMRAGDRGRTGNTYILSGEHCSVNDFSARVAELGGRQTPRLRFPVPVARGTAMLLDGVTRITGISFPLCRENVDIAARHRWLHSHAGATRDLGYQPRSLEEGLPETVEDILRRQRESTD